MTDNKKESQPNYFVLNPLITNKKLSKFFFKDDYGGYKYYPHYIHGTTADIPEEIINNFIIKFFSNYIDDPPCWESAQNSKLK
jgi:hypothetical protein